MAPEPERLSHLAGTSTWPTGFLTTSWRSDLNVVRVGRGCGEVAVRWLRSLALVEAVGGKRPGQFESLLVARTSPRLAVQCGGVRSCSNHDKI